MTGTDFVDRLAQEIRRVDGNHKLGAGALAEAICNFLQGESLRLFDLVYEIRKASGDPEGKLMQDELVARIAQLKASNDVTREAMPNDDEGHEFVERNGVFIYEVDFGEEGKGRYVRLRDFNRIANELQQALAGENTKEPGA